MTNLAEVVTLYDQNASQIPAMLRQSADSIESETDENDRTVAMIGVQFTEGQQVTVYGWGATDTLQAIAVLELAAMQLKRLMLDGESL